MRQYITNPSDAAPIGTSQADQQEIVSEWKYEKGRIKDTKQKNTKDAQPPKEPED